MTQQPTPLRITAQDYWRQQQALLPSGAAWPSGDGSVWSRLLAAFAEGWARLHNRAADLIEEADWRSTFELLPDWERIAGLPDPCAGAVQSLDGRRRRLVAAMTARGGQNAAYFIGLAEALGYYIEIVEQRPGTVEGTVSDALWSNDAVWQWIVKAPLHTIAYSTVDGTVTEPLAWWGNEVLECWIRARQPGHGTVLFAYINPLDFGQINRPAERIYDGGAVTMRSARLQAAGAIIA